MSTACLLLAANCLIAAPSGPIIGHAEAIDGDTIVIERTHIRLQGLDAEELDEPHGPDARAAMQAIIAGQVITCIPDGTYSYTRTVAVCFAGDIDIALPMVRAGFALDCAHYSKGRYRPFEAAGARTRLLQKGYCR